MNLLKLQRPKVTRKQGITHKELNKYFDVIIWMSKFKDREALKLLGERISKLVRNSGFQGAFMYLKEAMRLTTAALSGRPSTCTKVGVKIDRNGFPKIIPTSIRSYLSDSERRVKDGGRSVGAVLSALSVFRAFRTHVKPNISTIVDPFGGTSRTIAGPILSKACGELGGRLRVRPVEIIGGEKAGPNGGKAAGSSSIDAIAFILYPKHLYYLVRGFINQPRGYKFALWLLSLLIVSVPILVLIALVGGGNHIRNLTLGRLSVVYDQAGKARIVAISNYGVQLALKPLHLSIFDRLRSIEQDGTFNQDKPYQELLDRCLDGRTFYSFDLSAATDRLPIDLQSDILKHFGVSGELGRDVLSFPGKGENSFVHYAVGQPMGAYSSGAALALTHHVIVRVAAIQAGFPNFKDYCVLGDDIVIANSHVADQYLSIMKMLGVDINLTKSVISSEFAEFAKRLRGPAVEYSPIGAGLVTCFIRDKFYSGTVFLELAKLGGIRSLSEALMLIESNGPVKAKRISMAMWVIAGLNGVYSFDPMNSDHPIMDRMLFFNYGRRFKPDMGVIHITHHMYAIGNALLKAARRHTASNKKQHDVALEFFTSNWGRIFVTKYWPTRLLEAFLRLISPGFGFYIFSFVKAEEQITSNFVQLNSGFTDGTDMDRLLDLQPVNISSIDWGDRQAVRAADQGSKTLCEEACGFFDMMAPPRVRTRRGVIPDPMVGLGDRLRLRFS